MQNFDLRTMVINGQPMLAEIPHLSTIDLLVNDESVMGRMAQKIDRSAGDDGCHLWTGAVHKDGYGGLWTSHGMIRAHRLLYRSVAGRVPTHAWENGKRVDVIVGHTCHDEDALCPGGVKDEHRLCVNERHLALQTRKYNVLVGRRWAARELELAS